MASSVSIFELGQRRATLTRIIITVLIVAALLGAYDLQFDTPVSVVTLFGLSLACVPILRLNQRGRYEVAAVLLSIVLLIVISLNVYDGDGVHDAGILAYPVFIMIGALLLGKRAAPAFALAALAAIAAITYLEITRRIQPAIGATTFETLIPIVLLILTATVVVWSIVHNLELAFGRVRASEAELRESYDLTLKAWGRIIEQRDRAAMGHTERVADMAVALATAMGLTSQQLEDIRRGALLHDIGKLGTPDSILQKPGDLTEDERAVVREHTSFAHSLLSPIPHLKAALEIPWCHHERWDGTGYPRKLHGEEIPLAARIFSVVDVWDALTSDRPYRRAWTRTAALEHIRSLSGSHFDPEIVAAFERLNPAQKQAGL